MKKITAFISSIFSIFLFSISPTLVLAQTAGASLAVSPSTGTFNHSCSFTVSVVVNTAGVQTDGVDAVIFYDPTRFRAVKLTSGSLYPDYPTASNFIDQQNGKISITGVSSTTQAFSGSGTLATIDFTVLDNAPAGATQLKFDFDPNDKTKTTDSNIVQRGTTNDILSSVTDGNYTVGSGSCLATAAQGAPSVTDTSSSESATVTLPASGNFTPTWMLAGAGAILVLIAIAGLALL
ncbi:cohesin domain-containing protein [Patescibacteria group bacterium]|nr:cohesin domain-containing protein [Patescibacteria group bacterium]